VKSNAEQHASRSRFIIVGEKEKPNRGLLSRAFYFANGWTLRARDWLVTAETLSRHRQPKESRLVLLTDFFEKLG
jgi:hypothetical protein